MPNYIIISVSISRYLNESNDNRQQRMNRESEQRIKNTHNITYHILWDLINSERAPYSGYNFDYN